MPITSSAKKALRASKKKRVFNLRKKSSMDKTLKEFRSLVTGKNKDAAIKMIPTLYKVLDKAVKSKYIKANTSSRLKSRAMASIKKLG